MEIAAAILATVLLVIAAFAISRAGGRHHQEDLNDHSAPTGSGDTRDLEPGMPDQPKADRPAGPDAEAMGVTDEGRPSPDPTAEQRR
jgi:type IV secretory pathway VirB10-like protein